MRAWAGPVPGVGVNTQTFRIAQVVGATEGAHWAVDICRVLRDRGHDTCAIVGGSRGGLVTRLQAAGVPTFPAALSFGSTRKIPAYLGHAPMAVLRLARLLRRLRVDVVHTHLFNAILIGRLAGWLARIPVRVSMVPGPWHLEAGFTATLDRLTASMDHRVVASSECIRTLYRKLGVASSRLACIYYGADAARFDPSRRDPFRVRKELGIDPDAPLIGHVAHFYPPVAGWHVPPALRGQGVKGHEYLIESARLVRRRLPRARFLLVGHGWAEPGEQYRRSLEADCRAAGLADAVTFTGFRHDVPDVLAALTVSVQCSLSESLGGTIESLLMEVPTVATTVGGMPEAVRHGETGLLVPPRDPAALAEAIQDLVEHPDRARQLARAGRRFMADRFTLDRTVDAIESLYRDVADEQGLDRRRRWPRGP
jgi:glycosyltransferase involved in cell wall biosynthesis